MFALTCAMLLVGVWAVSQISIEIGGTISFYATNVNARISGSISGAETNPTPTTLEYSSTVEPTTEALNTWKNDLSFDSNGSPIKFTITIENLSSERALYVTLTDTVGSVENLAKSIKQGENDYTSGTELRVEKEQEAIFEITFTPTSTDVSIDGTYGYALSLTDENAPVDSTTVNSLSFSCDDSTMTASVMGNDASATSIEIPAYIEKGGKTFKVTTIGVEAFKNYASLTSISLPDTIERMGHFVFDGCTSLKYTELDGAKYLGNSENPHLVLVSVPSNVETFTTLEETKIIYYNAAMQKSSLKSVIISEGVVEIGAQAFALCSNLSSVDLPETVKYIGQNAFHTCSSLASINLPNGLKEIGGTAFYKSGLTQVSVPEGVKDIGTGAFASCTSLVEVSLPSTLKILRAALFQECSSLQKVNILEGVQQLETHVFFGCAKLEEVVFPNSVTAIGKTAFQNCSALRKVVLPANLTRINEYTFFSCSSLQDVNIPETVTYIGFSAFNGCKSLREINLPSRLEYIGDSAFNHCSGLQNETIIIPSTIKQIGGKSYDPENPDTSAIGSHVFYDCGTNALKSFKMSGESEYYTTIDGVLYRKENGVPTVLVAYPADKRNETYIMPDTVVDAYDLAMSRPYYLRKVVLGDSFVIKKMDENSINAWGNNLSTMIYFYSGVVEVECKETNPNYISNNGQVYSKDGTILYYAPLYDGTLKSSANEYTLTLDSGIEGASVTTIFHGAVGTDTALENNTPNDGTNSNEENQFKAYSKIIIPATVTTMSDEVITAINTMGCTIEVESGNTAFQVNADGDLERITTV